MAAVDRRKDAALAALLDSNTMTEAAEKAGIDRRTLYNYMHNDRDFAMAYSEMRSRQAIETMDELNAQRRRAVATLTEMLAGDGIPAAIRLKAAQMILQAAAEQEKTVDEIAQRNISANTSWSDELKALAL